MLPSLVAPADNADLAPGRTLVIGRTAGGGASLVKIEVDGKLATFAAARDGAFFANVALSAGKHVLGLLDGPRQAQFVLNVREGGKYRFHPKADACDGCHAPEDKGYRVLATAESRCRKCHPGKDSGKYVHGPLGAGRCTACHDPHGSSLARLQRSAKGCFACHEPFPAGASSHGPAAAGRCGDCHNPHASDFVTHLARKGNALCRGCHNQGHPAHPVARSEGSTVKIPPEIPQEEYALACLGCHAPHRSSEAHLLRSGAEALCKQCHRV
jgi:predicted CXXCH cytochrome family protein